MPTGLGREMGRKEAEPREKKDKRKERWRRRWVAGSCWACAKETGRAKLLGRLLSQKTNEAGGLG
jgi:hypothetical protein